MKRRGNGSALIEKFGELPQAVTATYPLQHLVPAVNSASFLIPKKATSPSNRFPFAARGGLF